MDFIDSRVVFPLRLFNDEGFFIDSILLLFLERYTDPVTGWATCHWDDTAQTRRRKASVFDGSIVPSPIFANEGGETPIGYSISCGWHPGFIADIRRDPQPEPELFEGVSIDE